MFNDRLQRIGDYPFDRLRALLGPVEPRAGLTPVSLALGEPQHTPPDLIRASVEANAGLWGRYPPMAGTPEVRRAIAGWLTRRYDLPVGMIDPDANVVPVSGTREALFLLALAAVPEKKAGQRPIVLMPNPFYQVYVGAAVLAGAEPVFLPATRETGFLPDLSAVPQSILERTALLYYCSPSNPQGMISGLETLKTLVRVARAHDFVLASDECYSEIYQREPPPGAAAACAALGGGLASVAILNSLSKRSSAPGLRSGFVAGEAEFIRRFTRLRDYGAVAPPLPLVAAATALWSEETHVEANRVLYRRKFDIAEKVLGGRFGFYRPPGGFYLWLDVGDGEAAARTLWRDAAVRVVPGAYFARADASGRNPGAAYIRCALVQDIETTRQALERLAAALT
jgi:succinyldiaminopimelate transaminase